MMLKHYGAGESEVERVAAFDRETRDLISVYNRFEIEQYGYEFPVECNRYD